MEREIEFQTLHPNPDQAGSAAVLLLEIDGVEATSTSRRSWIEQPNGRTQLIAVRMAPGSYAGTELLDAEPRDVWPAWQGRLYCAYATTRG